MAQVINKPLRDRIPVLTKMSYGLGTGLDMWGFWLYPGVAFAVFNMYLGVDPMLVGLALTLIRLFDAFTDPIAGWVSDNFRSKHGRRRPFILGAGALAGLCLPLLFLVSPGWVDIKILGLSAVFWYMLLSNMIYIPIISTFTVPYNSLGNELTPDYEERTSVMTYRSTMQKVFEVGNFYALRFTNLAWFLIPGTGKKNTLLGMQVYTSIIGIMMAIFAVIIFFRVKERYYEKVVAKKQERIKLSSSFYETLKCVPFRKMLILGGAFTLGTSMVGTLGYYATVHYVCGGNNIIGDNWNFWMGMAFMFGGLIGGPILNRVAHKIEKTRAVIVAASIGIIGYGGSWFLYTPVVPWLMTIASCLMGLSAAGLWMLHSSIGADIIDYDELNTGKRREGSFTGCASYILKLGNSLGGFFAGSVLKFANFDHSLNIQASETIFWIRAMLAGIPVLGLIVVIYIITRVKLNRQMCEDIRCELEKRRGQV